ncbi:hypothetical protein FRC09_003280, partial [Ceratobasidium sp. 395]
MGSSHTATRQAIVGPEEPVFGASKQNDSDSEHAVDELEAEGRLNDDDLHFQSPVELPTLLLHALDVLSVVLLDIAQQL